MDHRRDDGRLWHGSRRAYALVTVGLGGGGAGRRRTNPARQSNVHATRLPNLPRRRALLAFVFPVVFIAAAVAELISSVRRLIPR